MTNYAQVDIFGTETEIRTKDMTYTNVPYYSVELVRDKSAKFKLQAIKSPDDLYNNVEAIFKLSSKPQEHLVMIALNTKLEVIGAFTVHVGTTNASICSTKDILQRALLCNASSYVVAHNHPSGNPQPSQEDIDITRKLDQASELLQLNFLDHIIVGDGSYISLKDKGYI